MTLTTTGLTCSIHELTKPAHIRASQGYPVLTSESSFQRVHQFTQRCLLVGSLCYFTSMFSDDSCATDSTCMLQMVHISAEMWCASHIRVHISMETHDDHEQMNLVLDNKWTAIWCSVISWICYCMVHNSVIQSLIRWTEFLGIH